MNFTRFLIIDCYLFLIVFFLVYLFKKNKDNISPRRFFNKTHAADDISLDLPDLNKILDLEKFAKKEGSGIEFSDLIGLWKFVTVWKVGKDKEDSLSSSLLRLFSASLELRENQSKDGASSFSIVNSIEFGLLSIIFKGYGDLKGSQPRLPFSFECIQLKLGSVILLSRNIDIPNEKDKPFFALIAIEKSRGWLSARGRGGGLALWVKA